MINTSVSSVYQESSSSEQETEMQDPSPQPSTSQAQFMPSRFLPYIEGPKMDWSVNDGLYHRFLKWKLKCKNILDCKLVMLPESKEMHESHSLVWWFWMDHYVSWCLPNEELSLDTIWTKYEDFCKSQVNEVKARSDLLTSFHQGNTSVDE